MNVAKVSTCQSCQRPMEWRKTKNDKPIPYDTAPSPCRRCAKAGEVRQDCRDCEGAGRVVYTHFVTCQFAAQHRKAKAT
jgi:DnaJ-class molecular chaperone